MKQEGGYAVGQLVIAIFINGTPSADEGMVYLNRPEQSMAMDYG